MPKSTLAARQTMQVRRFFAVLESRIAAETSLANSPGIRATARQAAARRASDYLDDLTYLKHRYDSAAGKGHAQ